MNMKKYWKISGIIFSQMFMFYIFPMMAIKVDPMGMVFSIAIVTALLGVLMGAVGRGHLKYLYPIGVALLFLPTVFLYYNDSAMIHSLWYFILSLVGLIIGNVKKTS